MWTHGWHNDTATLWKDLPHSMRYSTLSSIHPWLATLTPRSLSFYCYFLYQMSFYIYSFLAITCGIDVRRKDFWILVRLFVCYLQPRMLTLLRQRSPITSSRSPS